MANLTYKYSNNVEFPIRYIKSRGRSAGENTYSSVDYETGEIIEINLNQRSLENLNKGFATTGVSAATRRKIAKHCKILALASTPRTVRNSAGKYVPHLTTFITLSLPSEQKHPDAEITKTIFGKFLDKSRKLGLLKNYVWRAEKQKNGNIHYHLLTDTFANFSLFQKLWFLACRELDYLDAYTRKFSAMDFETYKKQPFNKGKELPKICAAFQNGIRNKWRKPPSCHVTFITDTKGISLYVSKYISKEDPDNPNIVTGRTWGASQSVTAAIKNFCKDATLSEYWYNIVAHNMSRKLIESDFYTICIFSIRSLFAWFPETFEQAKTILLQSFTPCNYWRNSVGLFPKTAEN